MTHRPTPAIPDHWPSESALIADLLATFPGIHARPASAYGLQLYEHGAWVGGEALMPDEEPIFCTLACPDSSIYDGYVHRAFIEWLALRGWIIEEFDASVFMVTSKAQADYQDAQKEELADLIDQRREAYIVMHRLEVAVASCRLRISPHDKAATEHCQEEINHHKGRLAALLQSRRITSVHPAGGESPF